MIGKWIAWLDGFPMRYVRLFIALRLRFIRFVLTAYSFKEKVS